MAKTKKFLPFFIHLVFTPLAGLLLNSSYLNGFTIVTLCQTLTCTYKQQQITSRYTCHVSRLFPKRHHSCAYFSLQLVIRFVFTSLQTLSRVNIYTCKHTCKHTQLLTHTKTHTRGHAKPQNLLIIIFVTDTMTDIYAYIISVCLYMHHQPKTRSTVLSANGFIFCVDHYAPPQLSQSIFHFLFPSLFLCIFMALSLHCLDTADDIFKLLIKIKHENNKKRFPIQQFRWIGRRAT